MKGKGREARPRGPSTCEEERIESVTIVGYVSDVRAPRANIGTNWLTHIPSGDPTRPRLSDRRRHAVTITRPGEAPVTMMPEPRRKRSASAPATRTPSAPVVPSVHVCKPVCHGCGVFARDAKSPERHAFQCSCGTRTQRSVDVVPCTRKVV